MSSSKWTGWCPDGHRTSCEPPPGEAPPRIAPCPHILGVAPSGKLKYCPQVTTYNYFSNRQHDVIAATLTIVALGLLALIAWLSML